MLIVADDGKLRAMTCLPLHQLLGWLYTVNPNKIHPDAVALLLSYQNETTGAINDYWTTGMAISPRLSSTVDLSALEEMAGLRKTVQHMAAVIPQAIEAKAEEVKQEVLVEVARRDGELPLDHQQLGVVFRKGQSLAIIMGGNRADYSKVWRMFKDRFGLASYRDLPRKHYQEAIQFLDNLTTTYTQKN